MGVHSLGSVYSAPEWWVIHPWLGLVAMWFRMCGQVYLHIRLISYELMCGRATTARVATALQCDQLDMTEPTPTQLIRALMAKFLSWGRQQLRTSRGYAVPDLTRYGYGHGAGTTGIRIGLRPAPDGVVLHTGIHCLYRLGPGACLHLVNCRPVCCMARTGWR